MGPFGFFCCSSSSSHWETWLAGKLQVQYSVLIIHPCSSHQLRGNTFPLPLPLPPPASDIKTWRAQCRALGGGVTPENGLAAHFFAASALAPCTATLIVSSRSSNRSKDVFLLPCFPLGAVFIKAVRGCHYLNEADQSWSRFLRRFCKTDVTVETPTTTTTIYLKGR